MHSPERADSPDLETSPHPGVERSSAAAQIGPGDDTEGNRAGSPNATLKSRTRDLSVRQYQLLAASLCALYLVVELAYIARLPLVMDEFQGAYAVSQLTEGVPYRDFRPYKTVLGYYLQLPALLASDDPWTALLAVKVQAAVLTALMLILAAWHLQRHFRRAAIILALLLLVCMSTFLERSAELRVDMLTSIAGFASLLLLLDRRFVWAGVVSGVSILMSQKGVYYAVAGSAALGTYWLIAQRRRSAFMNVFQFCVATIATLLAYVWFWSMLASPAVVFEAIFVAPRAIAFDRIYDMRLWGWQLTLKPNPVYYALAISALIGLAERSRKERLPYREFMLLVYGLVLIALSVWHRQPWPYFFVLIIPTLFVLHVALLQGEIERHERAGTRPAAPLVGLVLAMGVLLPLKRIARVLTRDNAFQRETVRVADALLQPGETYLAGVNLLHHREQAVPELAWLDARRLTELRHAGPQRIQSIVDALDDAAMKFYVDNYRLEGLPPPLRTRLDADFSHFWGNIFVYSPTVDGSARTIELKFAGRYVLGHTSQPVSISGRIVPPGDSVVLARGRHEVISPTSFRLTLSPAIARNLDARYKQPQEFFPNVYSY